MSDYLKMVEQWVKEETSFVEKHVETDIWKQQMFLRLKAAWSAILEKSDSEKFYYVRKGDKFGISELMVNQLMILAYTKGRLDGYTPQYQKGWDDAMADVAKKLGFDDHE